MIAAIAGYDVLLTIWSVFSIQHLRSQHKVKEAVVYSSLLAVSACIGSLMMAGVHLPSFTEPAQMLFEPIGKMLLKR